MTKKTKDSIVYAFFGALLMMSFSLWYLEYLNRETKRIEKMHQKYEVNQLVRCKDNKTYIILTKGLPRYPILYYVRYIEDGAVKHKYINLDDIVDESNFPLEKEEE